MKTFLLYEILARQNEILRELKTMSAELDRLKAEVQETKTVAGSADRLKAEVQETKTVAGSAVTLIRGLAAQIRELKDDPAQLAALADELDQTTNELAAVLVENTPSE